MAWYLMIYDPRPDWRTLRVLDRDVSLPIHEFEKLEQKVVDGMRYASYCPVR
jgi:hypothetical protein